MIKFTMPRRAFDAVGQCLTPSKEVSRYPMDSIYFILREKNTVAVGCCGSAALAYTLDPATGFDEFPAPKIVFIVKPKDLFIPKIVTGLEIIYKPEENGGDLVIIQDAYNPQGYSQTVISQGPVGDPGLLEIFRGGDIKPGRGVAWIAPANINKFDAAYKILHQPRYNDYKDFKDCWDIWFDGPDLPLRAQDKLDSNLKAIAMPIKYLADDPERGTWPDHWCA